MCATDQPAAISFDKQDQVDKSMLGKLASSSSIAMAVGSATDEIEFRGEEKAKHAHDVILGFTS